jgi:hypothetical protein
VVPFTVTGLELGGAGVATFTDGTNTQTVNLVFGTTSYTVDLTGFGRSVTSSLVVSDSAGNTTGPTAGNSTLVVTSPALALTVAEYNTLDPSQWNGNPAYTSVTVRDVSANFAALDFSGLEGNGVTAVGSSSGALILTVAQYLDLGTVGVTGSARLIDTASAIEAMTPAEFAGMAGKNIGRLQSDGTLALTVAQYNNLNGVPLYANDVITLVDDAINIEALTAAAIDVLDNKGIDALALSSGSTLAFGLDQFKALGTVIADAAIDWDITGGGANDTFTFSRQSFSAADHVDGLDGTDTLALQANFGSLIFDADTITSIEKIKANGGTGSTSFDIRSHDGNVTAGGILSVVAGGFVAGDSLVFDGSAETDGRFNFTGGAAGSSMFTGGNGADTFNGGVGSDTIRYTAASQSLSAAYDRASGFDAANDLFSLWKAVTFDGTVGGLLRTTTLDDNLAAILTAGNFAADHAVLVNGTSGNLSGATFLVVNDGSAGYQAGQDLVVRVTTPTGISQSSFVVG